MDRTPEHNPPPAPPAASPLAFGDLLRRHRIAGGWSQEELAERAAVSARAISNCENGKSLRPQRDTVRLLAEALGLTEAERARFVAASRAGAQPVVPTPAATITSVSAISHAHLPAPLAPLLAREHELRALTALLGREDVRLVTLLGPGGVGKTRLALAVAAAARDAYTDGVYFVSLAPVREPEVLPLAVAQALGVAPAGKQTPFDALSAWLYERQVLLVLDNFEHLLSEAVVVANLLVASPGLAVLATSREPCGCGGSRIHAPPLATGAETREAGAEGSPAARVFAHYARAVRPEFAITVENAAAVEAICARLDGLPLALELAAARIRLFAPAQLLERLTPRLPILVNGARDAPVRHRGWPRRSRGATICSPMRSSSYSGGSRSSPEAGRSRRRNRSAGRQE